MLRYDVPKETDVDNVSTSTKQENDLKQTDDDNNCVICMDTITDVKTLRCKHKFCKECIDRILCQRSAEMSDLWRAVWNANRRPAGWNYECKQGFIFPGWTFALWDH